MHLITLQAPNAAVTLAPAGLDLVFSATIPVEKLGARDNVFPSSDWRWPASSSAAVHNNGDTRSIHDSHGGHDTGQDDIYYYNN